MKDENVANWGGPWPTKQRVKDEEQTLTSQNSFHLMWLPDVGWVPDPPGKNREGEAVS